MRVLFLLTLLLLPTLCFAQDSALPLEITADKALEWRQDDRQFVARGNALATQGADSLAADTLTALYREAGEPGNDTDNMQIWFITAEGNVVVKSENQTVLGDKGEYDLDNGMMTMTGEALVMTTDTQTITAKDRFEYYVDDGRLVAIGDARVVNKGENGDEILDADKVEAIFAEDETTGSRALKTAHAYGNVVITTPEELIKGDKGTYDAAANMATMTGNVFIQRGPNELRGAHGEVDLDTNISKLFAADGTESRVKGVFFPSSKEKK